MGSKAFISWNASLSALDWAIFLCISLTINLVSVTEYNIFFKMVLWSTKILYYISTNLQDYQLPQFWECPKSILVSSSFCPGGTSVSWDCCKGSSAILSSTMSSMIGVNCGTFCPETVALGGDTKKLDFPQHFLLLQTKGKKRCILIV